MFLHKKLRDQTNTSRSEFPLLARITDPSDAALIFIIQAFFFLTCPTHLFLMIGTSRNVPEPKNDFPLSTVPQKLLTYGLY